MSGKCIGKRLWIILSWCKGASSPSPCDATDLWYCMCDSSDTWSGLFKPKLKKKKKKKKKFTPKKFLIFRKMQLSHSNIKKFLLFWETKTLKTFLIFTGNETFLKVFYISGNGNPIELFIFPETELFLYIRKGISRTLT